MEHGKTMRRRSEDNEKSKATNGMRKGIKKLSRAKINNYVDEKTCLNDKEKKQKLVKFSFIRSRI